MNSIRNTSLKGILILITALVIPFSTFAADYPQKPITLVVGFSAGGGTDTYARALASTANKILGQPMVIVNKPGAGQIIAARFVARGRPDGYTLMAASMGSFILKQMIQGTPVEPFKDFKIIGIIGRTPSGIFVPKDSPYRTVQDLIADAKANPGKLRWSHTGRGNFHHIAGVAFLLKNGIQAQDVPFKGGNKTRAAIASKQVQFGFLAPFLLTGFEDQVRVLGAALNERDKVMTAIPTLKELNIPFTEVTSPITIIAPAGIPAEKLTVLRDAVYKMSAEQNFHKILKNAGMPPARYTAADSEKLLKNMKEEWKPVVEHVKAHK